MNSDLAAHYIKFRDFKFTQSDFKIRTFLKKI